MKSPKKVKAWALIDNGILILMSGQAPVYWLKSVAKIDSKKWYGSKVVPCTITYFIPKKPRRGKR